MPLRISQVLAFPTGMKDGYIAFFDQALRLWKIARKGRTHACCICSSETVARTLCDKLNDDLANKKTDELNDPVIINRWAS
jgi:hypothetical protein